MGECLRPIGKPIRLASRGVAFCSGGSPFAPSVESRPGSFRDPHPHASPFRVSID